LVNDEWKNKKVGFILGVDKPEVQVIDEKFAIRFSDVPILQYGNSSGFGNVERG
jgi:hypothetical protein